MTVIKNSLPIGLISEEYLLEKSPEAIAEELFEAVEYGYAIDKSKQIEPRVSFLNPRRRLTDEEEKNERFAEKVAKQLGLKYFPESCIAATLEQLPLLQRAYDIISSKMETDPIKDEKFHDVYKKKFVFYS